MAYDHSDKIGNQGDVAKHAVLATAIDYLAGRSSEPFHYVEAHSGRPEYTLLAGGAWQQGIKKFHDKIDFKSVDERIRPYADVCFSKKLEMGMRYWGSVGIAFRSLYGVREFMMDLFDTDRFVISDLQRYFAASPTVQCHHGDGLQQACQIDSASLVLIDPPNLKDGDRILNAMNALSVRNIPFICWTPRNANTTGNCEANTTAPFYGDTKMFPRYRFRWGQWTQQGMQGCQLTIFGPHEMVCRCFRTSHYVRRAMEWHTK